MPPLHLAETRQCVFLASKYIIRVDNLFRSLAHSSPPKLMARRRPSLHLGSTPIPPSLISSPYLTSPIFEQEASESHLPTEQDELWLQDTVPLSPTSSTGSSGSLATLSRENSRKRSQQNTTRPTPHSPPIIINHPPPHSFRSRDRSYTQPPPCNFMHPRDLHCPPNSHLLSQPHPPLVADSSPINGSHNHNQHPLPSPSQVHPYNPYTAQTRPSTWACSHPRKYSESDLTRLMRDSVTVSTGIHGGGRDSQREKNAGVDRETGANAPVSPVR